MAYTPVVLYKGTAMRTATTASEQVYLEYNGWRVSLGTVTPTPPPSTGGTSGPVSADSITDASAIGKSILKATTDVSVRSLIGAGTSNLAVGTAAGTAAAGNDIRLSDARTPLAHGHAAAEITGLLKIGTTSTTAAAGNDTRLSDARTPLAHQHGAADLSGVVKKVNGSTPDAAGNVTVTADLTGVVKKVNGTVPDAAGNVTIAVGSASVNYDGLPAGTIISTLTTTRPTSRTDLRVWFDTVTDPGANALPNDKWTLQ